MYTRVIYLISIVLAVSLAGMVQAKDTQFRNDDPGDSLWSTEGNWDNGLPTVGDWAKIRGGPPGATIVDDVGEVLKIAVGYDEGSSLTVVDGGSLTTEQDVVLGRNSDGTLNMMGGTIDCGRDFEVGYNNPAVANITGGTIIVERDVELPVGGNGQITHVNLHGGTLIVNDDLLMSDGGTMDITAGTLILDGDALAVVQGFIDSGWITAYNGDGTMQMDYDVTNAGQTTVTAIHKFMPSPADGDSIAPGNITLSWTVDAGTPVDVWFTTKGDPNEWTEDDKIVNKQAVTSLDVTTVAKQRYFWAVDTYAPGAEVPELGPVFDFYAENIDAGDDVTTWLDNGSADVALAGTVAATDPTTTVWTVVSEPDDPNSPDAVIADAAALNTSITLSALGEYVLQLQADDGEHTSSDTVTINVYSDSCEAAKSLPDYVPLVGDLNADCMVDFRDFALMAANWLENNAL